MIPNITRGAKMTGLVSYLAGPGRSNEHENPHVVAGHESVILRAPAGELSLAEGWRTRSTRRGSCSAPRSRTRTAVR
ncbi:hypothetical protein ASG56_14125 [Rhodococcus sp. Leaf7]|nr:hypothetical protein ASG56_14125 [Rhodococcus sp. Leaf7]KQU40660.1 hypothetical protein ASG64_14115 [Rhodococcus sp. Leaf247]